MVVVGPAVSTKAPSFPPAAADPRPTRKPRVQANFSWRPLRHQTHTLAHALTSRDARSVNVRSVSIKMSTLSFCAIDGGKPAARGISRDSAGQAAARTSNNYLNMNTFNETSNPLCLKPPCLVAAIRSAQAEPLMARSRRVNAPRERNIDFKMSHYVLYRPDKMSITDK